MNNMVLMGISDAIDIILILVVFSGLFASLFVWGIHYFIEWEKRQNK